MTEPGDVELAAVVDQDELIEHADRWAIVARTLAQIHENLAPGVPAMADIWVGLAADSFFGQLRPLLDAVNRLADQMLQVRNALMSVQEDVVPARRALYRDVIGWQRDLAGIAMDERRDPLGGKRFDAQRAAVTGQWTARAQADAGPLVDVLAAGAATLAAIEAVRPTFAEPEPWPRRDQR